MRVAFVTVCDPADRYAWSGLNHAIARQLQADGTELLPVGPLTSPRVWLAKARTLACSLRSRGASHYLWTLNRGLLKAYARQVEQELERLQPDVVFSPGTQPVAYLDPHWPVVFWTDAPFGAMHRYYRFYQELAPASVREGMDCDNRALRQCQAACYSSEWAAQAAVERHGADAAKVHVLPFGANLDRRAAQEDLPALAAQRLKPPWRFLFVGVDWERKGATQAVEVVRQLNALGHPSELIVVGCHPPKYAAALPDYVRAEGFISQHDPAGRERLSELFASSLFYLMPSRAEAYGIVFCEANVQGVPCLSTRTGGIPTIVHQGCNGALFDLDAPAGEYVDFVLAHTSYERYLDLARGSLAAYQERLSWKVNIRKLQELLAAASGRASVAASAVPETASLST